MAARRQLVVFKIGREDLAVDIMLTKEVVPMREITPVPETEYYVEGVMNLRGSLVPVLDLRKRLRVVKMGSSGDHRIIIANVDGRMVGLIVDSASEVIRVSEDLIEPAPDLVLEIGAGYVEGVVNLKDRFITLIDLRKALSGEITRELEEVIDALSRRTGRLTPAEAV